LKVGVFIGHTQPTKGGRYTFVVEALTALERMVGKCNHDFVVCHHGCEDIACRFPGLRSVDLNQRKYEILSWQGRLFERYPKLVRRIYRVLRLKPMNTRAQLISKGDRRMREVSIWDDYTSTLIKSLDEFASIGRAWP
jgi:hypothetical protein